ncbi:MAG: dephospho-CoA kinase [Candidatus Binatia bacterium]
MGSRPLVIGLTGGIGSGKSQAVRALAELGAVVIDADRIGHDVYAPGTPGHRAVVDAFGPGVISPDGSVDRVRLGQRVFADPVELERLNAIVHPLIREALADRIEAERSSGRGPIVVEAAVLLEANWDALVDEVWVVMARREVVERRLRNQRGMDAAAVAARMRAQLSDADRAARAQVIIDNSGTLAELRAEVERLWRDRLRG